jgi:adenylylsulfate kinase
MSLVIWITGLPGSGKSTVAEALKKTLKDDAVILRMDDLREVVTPAPTYSDEERELVYRSLIYTAKKLSECGHTVIIDATAHLRRWRTLARNVIGTYMEVYLKCSLDECRRREEERADSHQAPRNIYKKGNEGWPVPGVNVAYEEPTSPEVTIDTERMSITDAAHLIQETSRSLFGSRD